MAIHYGSSSPSTVFHLPAGYRPSVSHGTLALNLQNGQVVEVVINPDGAVRIFPLSGGTIANALVSMTGVHFRP